MLAQYLDLTEEYNTNGSVYFETSNYDYAVVQFANSIGDGCEFYSTLDSGSYSADNIFDPNPINWIQIVGTDLSDNSLINSFGNADGIIRFDVVGRYIKLQSATPDVTKLLVMLTKIS